MLKQKDLKRATLIEACIKGECTVKQVANALGLSERRVKQINSCFKYGQKQTDFKDLYLTINNKKAYKNYLSEKELDLLNRMVSAYLDVAEINALNMHPMTMKDWIKELDGFLTMTHKEILEGAGKISHEKALEKAHMEYDKYMKSNLTQAEKDYLEIMREDIKKLKQ